MPPVEQPDWPAYCCAFIRDGAGRFLLERRPPRTPGAPRLLTCFGGTREAGERPDECIRRELHEELRWGPCFIEALDLRVHLVLRSPRREVAWFYRSSPIDAAAPIVCEPGYEPVWVAPEDLPTAPLSGWHAVVFSAYLRGEALARIDE